MHILTYEYNYVQGGLRINHFVHIAGAITGLLYAHYGSNLWRRGQKKLIYYIPERYKHHPRTLKDIVFPPPSGRWSV